MKVEDRIAVAEAHTRVATPAKERLTLRQLRERAGLSIKQLEHAIGISRGTISGIETGTRTPTPEQLARLAEFYGVDTSTCRFAVLASFEVET